MELHITCLFIYFMIRSNFSRSLSSISSVQYFTTCRMSSSIGSNKRYQVIKAACLPCLKQCSSQMYMLALEHVLCCVPDIVVTHSRNSVLMSVRSLAPASAGAGRGGIIDTNCGISGFEEDVFGTISL